VVCDFGLPPANDSSTVRRVMKILIIGGGGREHALAWKIAQSRYAPQILCSPGNAGIAELAECVTPGNLAQFAAENGIDLTVVGPEGPLCAGIADEFHARGLRIFGPVKRAAQLEASKVFAKDFMARHSIPTAAGESFDNAAAARKFIRKRGVPVVVKADGLAGGKGVVVAGTVEEAECAVADTMERRVFGDAGARVVVEECLAGQELSVMALVDGESYRSLGAVRDYKRAFDAGRGPNTGGMGAYSPALLEADTTEIFTRTLAGLRAEGIDYRGVLYAGLMSTRDGPKVLEFNCRFGDPETQVLVQRMDFDLIDAALATIEGQLSELELRWKPNAAVCVVMAAPGYPGAVERGRVIEGLKVASELANVTVFHAGTKHDAAGRIVTDGGRVLGVTACGEDLASARQCAYEAVGRIHFDGAQYRRDIAARAS
jgi:phosphoribosylamine--glycine ligase